MRSAIFITLSLIVFNTLAYDVPDFTVGSWKLVEDESSDHVYIFEQYRDEYLKISKDKVIYTRKDGLLNNQYTAYSKNYVIDDERNGEPTLFLMGYHGGPYPDNDSVTEHSAYLIGDKLCVEVTYSRRDPAECLLFERINNIPTMLNGSYKHFSSNLSLSYSVGDLHRSNGPSAFLRMWLKNFNNYQDRPNDLVFTMAIP